MVGAPCLGNHGSAATCQSFVGFQIRGESRIFQIEGLTPKYLTIFSENCMRSWEVVLGVGAGVPRLNPQSYSTSFCSIILNVHTRPWSCLPDVTNANSRKNSFKELDTRVKTCSAQQVTMTRRSNARFRLTGWRHRLPCWCHRDVIRWITWWFVYRERVKVTVEVSMTQ